MHSQDTPPGVLRAGDSGRPQRVCSHKGWSFLHAAHGYTTTSCGIRAHPAAKCGTAVRDGDEHETGVARGGVWDSRNVTGPQQSLLLAEDHRRRQVHDSAPRSKFSGYRAALKKSRVAVVLTAVVMEDHVIGRFGDRWRCL